MKRPSSPSLYSRPTISACPPSPGTISSLSRKSVDVTNVNGSGGMDNDEKAKMNELFRAGCGMFLCYVVHDALQEKMFRFDGFEFGWFMTTGEVGIMLLGATLVEDVKLNKLWNGRGTFVISGAIGISVAGSHGFGNTALNYSSYPLKVAFKSCKLIPTMAIGMCIIKGKSFSGSEYFAAVIMCAGLIVLSLADYEFSSSRVVTRLRWTGPVLLGLSTSLDSIVPNLQEKLFKQTNARTVDMIYLSNLFMFGVSSVISLATGELVVALNYCKDRPAVLSILALQAVSAYCGLQCYLSIIKSHGGVAGVLLANGRKVFTIILSFLAFSKPCKALHLVGLALIAVGVYLGVIAKKLAIKARAKQLKEPPLVPILEKRDQIV